MTKDLIRHCNQDECPSDFHLNPKPHCIHYSGMDLNVEKDAPCTYNLSPKTSSQSLAKFTEAPYKHKDEFNMLDISKPEGLLFLTIIM